MEHGWPGAGTPLDDNDKRRLVIQLVRQLRCMECNRLYDPEGFSLVHRWQEVWVLSTRCRHCDELCHVVIFMQLDTEPEPVTDLTPEEAQKAADRPPLTADDVLDVHLLLHDFDGDFEALLGG